MNQWRLTGDTGAGNVGDAAALETDVHGVAIECWTTGISFSKERVWDRSVGKYVPLPVRLRSNAHVPLGGLPRAAVFRGAPSERLRPTYTKTNHEFLRSYPFLAVAQGVHVMDTT